MTKKDLMKYISAFVMGDAGVYYSGNNCRLVTNSVEEEYINWKQDILSNLTAVNKHSTVDKRGDRKELFVLTTRTHPIYTTVRKRVYVDQYRSIDPHYLTLLDWETLAILFMDDGSCSVDNRCNATPQVRLNTKRLSYADSWLLKKGIKDRLGIEFNIQRHYDRYFLALRTKDYEQFSNECYKYVLPCFNYKLL